MAPVLPIGDVVRDAFIGHATWLFCGLLDKTRSNEIKHLQKPIYGLNNPPALP